MTAIDREAVAAPDPADPTTDCPHCDGSGMAVTPSRLRAIGFHIEDCAFCEGTGWRLDLLPHVERRFSANIAAAIAAGALS